MTPVVPGARGPSGQAPPPPAWLNTVDLPIDEIAVGTPLVRVHQRIRDPIFFGPGAGKPPTYRFDSLAGGFGVLYLGLSLAGAVVETLLRNPSRKFVAYRTLAARASSDLYANRELKVTRLYGDGLQQVGCDNAISTGPYDPCGAWADALWSHPQKPDGIAYQSRHDSEEICLALFERPDLALTAQPPVALTAQLSTISPLLLGYGKSIDMMA